MVYGLWSSASAMLANQYRQDVAANNLANVNTIGFKHDLAILRERPVESQEDADAIFDANSFFDRLTGGTLVRPTVHSLAQGPANPTDRPLDAMIEGPGFFQIQTPDGIRYTRDGRFTVNNEGVLVSIAGGHPVLTSGGSQIELDGTGKASISDLGVVVQGDEPVGQLGVVEFDDPAKLRKIGGNLFTPTEEAAPRESDSKIISGMLEGSTVDPVEALVDMIAATRSFQMNANILSMQDTTLGRMINELSNF